MLSINDVLACSDTVVGLGICGMNHLFVRRSKKQCTSLLLSKFSRLILKSQIRTVLLFSFSFLFSVFFKYFRNCVCFGLGCLYITPTTITSLAEPTISSQNASTHFLDSPVFWINHHKGNKG